MTGLFALLTASALAAPADSDSEDLLFLGDPRPTLLRVHVQRGGASYTAAWEGYLQSLFTFLDRNNDGALDEQEAARAPKAAALAQQLRGGGFGFFGPANTLATLQDIAPAATAGKASFDDFKAYYRQGGFKPLVVAFSQDAAGQAPLANALTAALFQKLDTDRDGKLSKQELGKAEALIRELDANDDEVLTIRELLPRSLGSAGAVVKGPTVFVVIHPGDAAWVEDMLRLRDKDKDQKLSAAESGLDAETFKQLDADRDGALNADELAQLPALGPDLEVVFQVQPREKLPAVDLSPPDAKPSARVRELTRGPGGLAATIGAAQFNLWRHDTLAPNNYANFRRFHLELFGKTDQAKKGFLVKQDLEGKPQLQLLLTLLPLADRNADGQLTEAELSALFELQDQAATCYLSLGISDQGSALFSVLDRNHDSRLSVPELRTAWERLVPWSKDGNTVARGDVPTHWQLTLAVGPATFRGASRLLPDAPVPVPTEGPEWFRKTDRNGDGYVSRREFLGTRQDFDRLDKNSDGLIDRTEAEQAAPTK